MIGQTLGYSKTQPTKSRSAPGLARLVENGIWGGKSSSAARALRNEQQASRKLPPATRVAVAVAVAEELTMVGNHVLFTFI